MRILDRVLPLTISRQICTLPSASLQNKRLNDAQILSDQNPTSPNIISWNGMINACVQKDQMLHAQNLFDEMPVRDIVSWNTIFLGLNKSKNPERVYKCFLEMGRLGLKPNSYTLSSVVSAVLGTEFKALVPQIHAIAVCLGLNTSSFVGSTLMKGYRFLGDPVGLGRAFDEILVKNAVCWNILVWAYMELGWMAEAQWAFDRIPEKNIVSWTSLVNGYIKNKMINKARAVFNKMSERNVVSWTVMISGYVQSERFVDALKLFLLMLRSETQPNQFTLSSVLDACAGCSYLLTGQQVHSIILKSGTPDDVILSTSLVDMYAKCGEIDTAFRVFEFIAYKNLACWNSMIGGFARHGLATRALEELDRMTNSGIKPDEVTFINILSACGHGGMVKEGERHFSSMGIMHGIQAGVEHYACMVDLYGRAGQLDKAGELIKGMPFEPDVVVWGALLGACGLHSSLELGEFAAEGISKLKIDHPAAYTVLSKIHGEKEVWNSVLELKNIMKEKNATKQKAGSWVETATVED
ncbi:hypothetical protein SLA2020_170690 [Shorea laevis]